MTFGGLARIAPSVLLVSILSTLAWAQDGVLYRWRDDAGQVHLTQGRDQIPERFRVSAQPLGQVGPAPPAPVSDDPVPGPPGKTPGEAAPGAPAAAKPPGEPEKRPAPTPPPPSSPQRRALDEQLSEARTSSAYLAAGAEYLALGLPLGARTAAAKAAAVARSSREWEALAQFYATLGDEKAAGEAKLKAARLAEWEAPPPSPKPAPRQIGR